MKKSNILHIVINSEFTEQLHEWKNLIKSKSSIKKRILDLISEDLNKMRTQ